jgi:uncharacterized protein YodC (DUF2158 family)
MAPQAFKVGDLVVVKSGSPLMTVEAVNADGIVTCVFYEGSKRHNQDHPAEVLEHHKVSGPYGFGGSVDDY